MDHQNAYLHGIIFIVFSLLSYNAKTHPAERKPDDLLLFSRKSVTSFMMETPQHDPNNRPKQGAALFRWILEQRKLEESKPFELTESQKKMIEELKRENAERGTPIISVQLPV